MNKKLVIASALIMASSFITTDVQAQLLDKVINTVLDEVTGSGSSSSKKSKNSQSNTQNTSQNANTQPKTEQSGTSQVQKPTTSADPDDIFNAKQTVENSGKPFSKPEFGYSIKYPDGWKYALSTENTVSFTNPEGEAEISIQNILGSASNGKYKTIDELIKDLKAQISNSTVAPRFIPERDYALGSTAYKGKEFAAEYTMNGIKYRQWFVVIPRMDGKIFYSIYMLVPAESWTKYLSTGKEVIAGLKIENDSPAASTANTATVNPGILPSTVNTVQTQAPATASTAVPAVETVQTNINAVQTTASRSLSSQYQGISQDINWINTSIAGESRAYQIARDKIRMNLKYNTENAYKNVKCPKCGKIGSFVFVNDKYGWQCPDCSYFAGSLLSQKDESGKTYGEQLDLAYKDSCDKVTQLRKKGNDICAKNGLAPYWDLNSTMPFSKDNTASLPQGSLPVAQTPTPAVNTAAPASSNTQNNSSGSGIKPPDDFTF